MKTFTYKYTFCLLALVLLILGCQEPYSVDNLGEGERIPVVYARITNGSEPQFVKLTYTSSTSDDSSQDIEGATVYVSDTKGNSFYYEEVNPGYYQTERKAFIGEIGEKYTLNISLPDGSTLQSLPQKMPDTIGIEGIEYKIEMQDFFVTDNSGNTEVVPKRGIAYYIVPNNVAGEKVYYRVNTDYYSHSTYISASERETGIFSENRDSVTAATLHYTYYHDCYNYYQSSDLPIFGYLEGDEDLPFEERQVQSQFILYPENGYFGEYLEEGRDFVEWIMLADLYAISEETYSFYKDLKLQLEAPDRIYDPIPNQLKSNMFYVDEPEKQVLGYFEVSSRNRIYNGLYKWVSFGAVSIQSRNYPSSSYYESDCFVSDVQVDTTFGATTPYFP